MFFKLLLLFVVVPLIELFLLLEISSYIGVFTTIMIIVLTGVIGTIIAKMQGYMVINNIRRKLNSGQMPTDDLISALLILMGGVTLLTPGFLTDITGFLLILPGSRDLIAALVKKYFLKYVKEKKVDFHYKRERGSNHSSNNSQDDYIDIDPEDIEDVKE
ncbi:MAG: FxsA family protein [Halanaerobium sp. MSAO_Bac5]|nr:MAG: FxsA family protein [Halanaerobium sp. MSAO_Bac5]